MDNDDQDHACYMYYATYENRLSSFNDWPLSLKIRPIELSEAGFFYLGKGDSTLCFHCGLGLKDWKDNDDVWEEHARFSTKCKFVLLKKGKDFVNSICVETSRNKQFEQQKQPNDDSQGKKVEDDKHSKTEERILCKICLTNEMNTMFIPCSHIVACIDCVSSVDKCPICRASYTKVAKVYLS
jgi:hypothetical protein